MRDSTAARLAPVVVRQDGLVRTDDLVRLGLHPRLALREGWLPLAPALWLAGSGPPSDLQLLRAARLHAGRDVVVTGALVCRLLGVRDVPGHVGADVLVPHGRRLAGGPLLRVRQTRRLPAPLLLGGELAVAPLARAVADCARREPGLRQVRALVLAAVDDHGLGRQLVDELTAGGAPGSAHLRTALRDAGAGARSAPEAEAADLVRAVRGAPPFVLNPRLVLDGRSLGCPDGWFPGLGTGWEVDSVRHHGGSAELERTLARHRRFDDAGLQLLHVTPARLRADGAAWARDVVATARRSLGEPPGLDLR